MAKSEEPASDAPGGAQEDAKRIAKAGPAGVLPAAMIVPGLLAIVVLGIILLATGR